MTWLFKLFLIVAGMMVAATDPKQKFTIKVHPAADLFPMIDDDELKEMAASVVAHGLREKIQAIPEVHDDRTDWVVVDGRNRLAALRLIGLKDEQIVAEFMEPVNLAASRATAEEYVLMANIERRNLTREQRRDLAGKLALMIQEQQKDKPREEQVDSLGEAAKKAGVSRRTAATAKQSELAKKPGAKRKPAPKKKANVGVTPAQALNNVQKITDSVKRLGHNWPGQTGLECFVATRNLLEMLASKKNIADEAEKKLGGEWFKIQLATPAVKAAVAEATGVKKIAPGEPGSKPKN